MGAPLRRRALLRALLGAGAGLALPGALGACTQVGGRSPWRRRRGLRLVFYTDVHARTEWDTPRALARAAEAIRREEPDLVLAGGDLIAGGYRASASLAAERWDVYEAMHRSLGAPVYPALGNHDLVAVRPRDGSPSAADPRRWFRERLGVDRTYYAFDAAGVHFVVLDSVQVVEGPLQYEGRVSAAQRAWLREDLARLAPETPVVVVSHIPLLTAFYGATEGLAVAAPRNRVVVNNVETLGLFSSVRLVLVLQGHLHVNEAVRWRGTTFLTGGAISGRWWRGPWQGTPEGFCVVTLDEGTVDWRYVSTGWKAQRPPAGA